ncbi:MAG: AAA family ATPase [Chitinophagales bacterium]
MPDQSEFITHFEVSNFKKFDHLVVNDIGQFNLITGDNNVGKTSLLEALSLNLKSNNDLVFKFHSLLCDQHIHHHAENKYSKNPIIPKFNYFNLLKNKEELPLTLFFNSQKVILTDIDYFRLKEEDKDLFVSTPYFMDGIEYKYWIRIDKSNVKPEIQFMYEDDYYREDRKFESKLYKPIVKFRNFYERDLNKFIKELSQIELLNLTAFDYEEIVSIIKIVIIPDIIAINIQKINNDSDEMIFIATKSSKGLFVNVTRFGDGVQKIIRYLIEVYYAKKNGFNYFLIDEIDTGIHFSRLKIFWKEFLMLATKLNIQIFATTHSQECIEAYAQALEELGMEEKGRLIEMEEHNGKVYASTLSYENIKAGLISNTNLRGA